MALVQVPHVHNVRLHHRKDDHLASTQVIEHEKAKDNIHIDGHITGFHRRRSASNLEPKISIDMTKKKTG